MMTRSSMRYKLHISQTRAFTLVEMLVVLGIIAMLMAIILPALSQTRKQARKIVCSSNMSQIALAMQGYASRNDDWIIQAREIIYAHSLAEALACWNIALMPYIGKSVTNNILQNRAELWLCPEDRNPYPLGFKNCPHEGMTSYALNGYYEDSTSAGQIRLGPAGRYKLADVFQPSECFLMGETSYAAQFYDADAPSVVAYSLRRDGHHRCTSGFYHNGSMNLLYVDGHVENIKGRKTNELVWPKGFEKSHQNRKYMYWPDLTLPTAAEDSAFWGPGY